MKTAMIFAAGRGERLKPLTDTQPKALCQVHGISLIEHHINRLAQLGFEKIVINHAHLGGEIRARLKQGERWNIKIIYSPEPPGALETGGGMVHALKLLGDEPFITINADIFTDYDFSQLSLPKGQLAHLVLVNKPAYYSKADFGLTAEGLVTNDNKQFTFTGIACYSPEILKNIQPGRFSITPIVRQAVNDSLVGGSIYQGKWIDIGTMERLTLANQYTQNT